MENSKVVFFWTALDTSADIRVECAVQCQKEQKDVVSWPFVFKQ